MGGYFLCLTLTSLNLGCVEVKTAVKALPVTDVLCSSLKPSKVSKRVRKFVKIFSYIQNDRRSKGHSNKDIAPTRTHLNFGCKKNELTYIKEFDIKYEN